MPDENSAAAVALNSTKHGIGDQDPKTPIMFIRIITRKQEKQQLVIIVTILLIIVTIVIKVKVKQ